ncbi:prefoldin subunit 5 [Pullulanibacillus pueri]|uniref:Uncharacterized protein n=1 Tax=Pullulanibacillus pueri TaxID=1437324 RepID=A0A8J2ZUA8_9BACL|nr:hypothetical protein [Pullulanibacillus pueri]MBM7681425.1 prefoldin subunit 5 [Pullulanibacillus pueri]GGH78826.1 hypothetical protein GCM10007096_12840 [Pullulanibacillus pueri]
MAKNFPDQGISKEVFTHKLESLENKIEQIDRKVSSKADEIVSLQILEHRRELEEIYQVIKSIDAHILHIESELSRVENVSSDLHQVDLDIPSRSEKKNKRTSKVTPLFT